MSKRGLVQLGPIATADLLSREVDPSIPNVFDRAKLWHDAPVLVDHDFDRDPVGRVLELCRFDNIDRLWLAALIEVHDPPAWLRKGTPVSVGGNTLARGEFNGWKITRDVLVREISLVSPAFKAAQAGARVLTLHNAEYEGEPINHGGRGLVLRRNCGQILGVR